MNMHKLDIMSMNRENKIILKSARAPIGSGFEGLVTYAKYNITTTTTTAPITKATPPTAIPAIAPVERSSSVFLSAAPDTTVGVITVVQLTVLVSS